MMEGTGYAQPPSEQESTARLQQQAVTLQLAFYRSDRRSMSLLPGKPAPLLAAPRKHVTILHTSAPPITCSCRVKLWGGLRGTGERAGGEQSGQDRAPRQHARLPGYHCRYGNARRERLLKARLAGWNRSPGGAGMNQLTHEKPVKG